MMSTRFAETSCKKQVERSLKRVELKRQSTIHLTTLSIPPNKKPLRRRKRRRQHAGYEKQHQRKLDIALIAHK